MIDFCDTPMGDDLLERKRYLEDKISELEDQIDEYEREIWKIRDEYDMQEEMWEDSLEEGNDL